MGGHGYQYFHADRICRSIRAQRSFHPHADSLRLFPAVLSGIFGVTLFGIFLTPNFFYSLLRFSKQRERNDKPRRTTAAYDCASIPTTSTMRRSRLVAACR